MTEAKNLEIPTALRLRKPYEERWHGTLLKADEEQLPDYLIREDGLD